MKHVFTNDELELIASRPTGITHTSTQAALAAELLMLRQAFQVPVLWEVQGLYFDKAEDAKGMFPDDEPKPLCYKPAT